MTEPDDVWAEVARRAAVSRFSGVTADDDDVIVNAELREAQLNPNRQGGQGGVGAPGMMPPMMMGGMGAGGAGASGGSGGGGLGGGSAAAAAAATTRPPQASTGLGVQAAQAAPLAEEVEEEPGVPDIGGLGGGGIGGGGGGLPDGGGAGGGAPVGPADGFSADPVAVRGIASRWAELAQEIQALDSPAFDAALGLVQPPQRPQQAVNEQVRTWTTGAGEEFDALVGRLHDVAGQYEAVEESGTAEIREKTADE
ncbi:hypothetical protein GCM10028820_01430 [Tessaracoccus terricola]